MSIKVGNVAIVVRTRNEHCPPHIHASCLAQGWDARFKFSFVNDDVTLWDVRPPQKAPSIQILNNIGAVVFNNRVAIRARWWTVMTTTCLENQRMAVHNGILMPPGGAGNPGKPIVKGTYVVQGQILTVEFHDGTIHQQTV